MVLKTLCITDFCDIKIVFFTFKGDMWKQVSIIFYFNNIADKVTFIYCKSVEQYLLSDLYSI